MRAALRSLGRRIGHRGDTLLLLAIIDFGYGLSLWRPPPEAKLSSTLAFIADVLPLWLWALLWTLVGIACTIGAFMRQDRWAYTLAVMLKVLWGGTFLFGWALADLDRGWVGAIIWLGMAGWAYRHSTWPEPQPDGIRLDELVRALEEKGEAA